LVQLENAQVHRFGVKEPAFKNLSLTLKNNERLVIVGPVSAGKTTLAEVISTIGISKYVYIYINAFY
jgi:molybdate transport system ATP-binding protein